MADNSKPQATPGGVPPKKKGIFRKIGGALAAVASAVVNTIAKGANLGGDE